jgi:hypothetical protein
MARQPGQRRRGNDNVRARRAAAAIAVTLTRFAINYRAGDGRTVAGAGPRGRGPPSGAAELPVVTSTCKRGTH